MRDIISFLKEVIQKQFGCARNRQLVHNGLYNLLGFVFPIVVLFLFTPILINRLGVEGYGLWSISISFLGLMGIMQFGAGTTISKYIAEYEASKNEIGLSSMTSVSFLFVIFIGLVFSTMAFIFSPIIAVWFQSREVPLSEIVKVLQISSLGILPTMLRNVALAVPMGMQDYRSPNIIKLAQNVLTTIGATLIVSVGGKIILTICWAIVVILITMVASLWIAGKELYRLNFKAVIKKGYTKKTFRYIFYTGLQNIGGGIFNSLDRITVGMVLELSAVTYYSVSIQITRQIVGIANAVTQALMPAASSLYIAKRYDRLRHLLSRSTFYVGLISILIGGSLILLSKPILSFLIGAADVFRVLPAFYLLTIAYTVQAINSPSFHIANGIGAAWLCGMTVMITGLGTILLILILGPRFGILGAAKANFASLSLLSISIYLFQKLKNDQLVTS